MRRGSIRLLLAAFVLLTSLAATATAGDGFEAEELEDAMDWLAVLYLVVFAVAVSVVAFKDAKRTHLD